MNFYEIKTEIRNLSLIDERYRFIAENIGEYVVISLYEFTEDRFSNKSEILRLDFNRFIFDERFKNIKNKTLKSLLMNLACKACE